MTEKTINDTRLIRLVDAGVSQSDIARELGVTRQAVHKRLRELRGKTTKVVAAKKVEEFVDRKIDALDQLSKINQDANEILDLLMRWNRGDEVALQALESQVKKVRIGTDEELDIRELKFKDPRELALRAMAEIRGQLSLQLEIFQTLYSLQAAEEFQTEVLEVIGQLDTEARNAIIQGLNKRRAVRSALRFT